MNKERLRQLIILEKEVDVNDELEWENIFEEKKELLCMDENYTIDFILTCSEEELDYISNAFEDLIFHFKSQRLLDVIISSKERFVDLDINVEIEFAKKAFNIVSNN